MRWACTPAGVGRSVGFRMLPEGESAGLGEFETTQDPTGLVLAVDLQSLRFPTAGEQLEQLRVVKLAELVTARDAAIVAPVEWNAAAWSALPEDQSNLIQTVSLWAVCLQAGAALIGELHVDGVTVPSTVPWKTIDNDIRMLSFNEAVRLAAAMSLAKQTAFGTYWQLEQLVAAATSAPEIAAVTWPVM